MENDFEKVAEQIKSLCSGFQSIIKRIGNQQDKATQEESQKINNQFLSFVNETTSSLVPPVDLNPIITKRYQKQYEEICNLQQEINRLNNEIDIQTKKFNEKFDEEKRKFNMQVNNMAYNYSEQKEAHDTNHDNQMNDLEEQIYELKETFDSRFTNELEKVVDEKKMLTKVYQNFQKEFDELKTGIDQIDHMDTSDRISRLDSSLHDTCDQISDFSTEKDFTDSMEVKARDMISEFSDTQTEPFDEIEKLEEENLVLKQEIEDLKAKYEPEIMNLKNQLNTIEADCDLKLSATLKSNQKKYDSEFDKIRAEYSKAEEELIDKLNKLKKEKTYTINSLKNELSKIKEKADECQIRMNKRIRSAKLVSATKIQEKENQIQKINVEHKKLIEEMVKSYQKQLNEIKSENSQIKSEINDEINKDNNDSDIIFPEKTFSPRSKQIQARHKIVEPQKMKNIQSPRRMKQSQNEEKDDAKSVLDKIDNTEKEYRKYMHSYQDIKKRLENEIKNDQHNLSIQIQEFGKASEIAQNELKDLNKTLDLKKNEIMNRIPNTYAENNNININQNDKNNDEIIKIKDQDESIRKMKDELDRLRTEVSKRRALQSLQAKHHKEMNEIQSEIDTLEVDTFQKLLKESEKYAEILYNEKIKSNDEIQKTSLKLECVLKELKEAKVEAEESAIKDHQKWNDVRNDISNTTVAMCNKMKSASRPTSSVSKARPIVSSPKLPPLQKSQS
ncbi:hypothetical protein TRFO_18359 [Tritrichomonas foetus]|uniref:Uncharacterized protein n=1 Tax=Tritrichomonas foetus TaxID=1144522 RepID=A0A1J4KKZ5_9EUKA|nr:hypothetical protein TRFO_18359 [Tritrichomonas foetus]|eukprot:OHT11977.1 hypothetical protein TRFO_18359 [Tritrichomonas foetus]